MDNRQSVRKAAILLTSLDDESADALLRQMSPQQAHLVQQAVVELGQIDAEEQHEVIEEFFRIGPLVPDKEPAGIDLDDRLTPHLLQASDEGAPRGQAGWGDSTELFRFLHAAPSEKLRPFLEREHPQTIAVVVSHLPPERAGQLLASLPAALQAEVARRLVDLEETDPEILREIEQGLRTWLSQQEQTQQRRTAGLVALSNILQATDPDTQQVLLSNLAAHDRQLAGKLLSQRTGPMTFSDLELLDDTALTTVLHQADTEVMILALAGASAQMVERILGQLPLAEANTLRYAFNHLGPIRASDVQAAQQEIVELAQSLQRSGQLSQQSRHHLSLAG